MQKLIQKLIQDSEIRNQFRIHNAEINSESEFIMQNGNSNYLFLIR